MSPAHVFERRCLRFLVLLLPAAGGCSQANATRPAHETSVEGILSRCAASYRSARSITATGLIVDQRHSSRRMDPVRWDYVAPDRSRLQIGLYASCIGRDFYWTYDAAADRFYNPVRASPSPIESSAYALTDRALFVPAGLVEKGDALFAMRDERYEPWRLEGAAWLDGRPCYKLVRRGRGADSVNRWTLWIDQDTHLLRAWAWHRDRDDGRSDVVWQCTFSDIRLDQAPPEELFREVRPQPIALPGTGSAAATGRTG